MTVQAQNSVQYYNGPIEIGTELSIVEFTFIDNSHVSAKVRGNTEVWQYGYDYTISGAQTLIRTITVQRRVAENEVLAVYLDVPITQNISPEEGGNFPASTNEYVLDKLTHISQMLDERLKRSLQISIDTPFSGTLPAPEPNKALKISPDGNSFVMSDYDPDTALVLTEQYRTEAQAAAEVAVASKDTSIEKANIATEKAAVATTQANRVEDIYTEAVPALNQIISDGQSGLSETIIDGQQSLANASDALRQNQITDCVLSAPQNIKLQLTDSGLTLLTTSKVLVPAGPNTFLLKSPTKNITRELFGEETGNDILIECTVDSNNIPTGLSWSTLANTTSGTEPPTSGLFYNTVENTIHRYTLADGKTEARSFPIAKVTLQAGKVTAIEEVYDYIGFIGSSIWYVKDITVAIPNYLNNDHTLNNTLFTTTKIGVTTRDISGVDLEILLGPNGITWSGGFSYNKHSNKRFVKNTTTEGNYACVGWITSQQGKITQFKLKKPFQALDYNLVTETLERSLLDITPNRFLTPVIDNPEYLELSANTYIQLDTRFSTRYFKNISGMRFKPKSMLDSGTTLQAGKAYSIFLVPSATGGVELKVSLNSTAPTGYSPLDTRRIGGFSTLCADAGTISWHANHPLSGFVAGDILPQSVWTIYHRPYASPNNCIYIPAGIPFWRTIYDHSGTLSTTSFEYGGTVTRTRTFYGHMQDMMHAGYILPTYEQAAISGYGCEPLKAVLGKAETSITTAGGHVNESNNRIISIYGAEDCAGCTWKLTTIGAIGGSNWSTDASVGVHQYGSVNVLRVGGAWGDSGYAGPFATLGGNSALDASSHCASFGVSYPLPRKSEGTS